MGHILFYIILYVGLFCKYYVINYVDKVDIYPQYGLNLSIISIIGESSQTQYIWTQISKNNKFLKVNTLMMVKMLPKGLVSNPIKTKVIMYNHLLNKLNNMLMIRIKIYQIKIIFRTTRIIKIKEISKEILMLIFLNKIIQCRFLLLRTRTHKNFIASTLKKFRPRLNIYNYKIKKKFNKKMKNKLKLLIYNLLNRKTMKQKKLMKYKVKMK